MPRTPKTHIRTEFFVRGKGTFPLDMLRYDSCVPAREQDALDLGDKQDLYSEPRVVKLYRFSQDGSGPTLARWASFGWGCYTAEELELERKILAERAARGKP